MTIASPAFHDGDVMPVRFTIDGGNNSPPLEICNPPDNTQSFALVMEDIDSPIGPFTHWVVWNIPPTCLQIAENALPNDASVGLNGFGRTRYDGPCPPSGKHYYHFRLFALDAVLDIGLPGRRDVLETDMIGCILAEATLAVHFQNAAI